jgi:ribosomal protein S27E
MSMSWCWACGKYHLYGACTVNSRTEAQAWVQRRRINNRFIDLPCPECGQSGLHIIDTVTIECAACGHEQSRAKKARK